MKRLFSCIALLVSLQSSLWAQATATATLQGTIFDSSKAGVPKAELSLVNDATGAERKLSSGESGSFTFDGVAAGSYKLTVKAPGFQTAVYENVVLAVAQSTVLNPTINPGAQSSVVEVQEASILIDSAKTDVSLAISPTEIQELPMNSRDFANLAFLAPGAKPVASYDPTKNRIAVFGINGSSGRNVNITVNGIDDKDNTVGGPVMQLPLEAVQEFNISTQRFSAANGRSEGAAINLITKSGSNQFHGSLFLNDRNTALNANDYLSKQSGAPTPEYGRQQYGGAIGGPVKKDKLFLFFAIERLRETAVLPVTASAFSQLTLAVPLGAKPVSTIPIPYNDQRYTGRADWNLTSKHSLSFTYNSQTNDALNDQSTNTVDASQGNFTKNALILSSATITSVLSPTMVNSFTAGYQYWHNLIDTTNRVNFVSFPGESFGTNANVPQESYQAKWQFRDDLSRTIGKHTVRFGGDYVNVNKLGGFFGNTVLNFTFLQDPSTILNNPGLYPQGFSTPGLISAISASNGNPYFATIDGKMLGLYANDDYRVTSRLTVNLGLRWDKDYNLNGGNTQAKALTYQYLNKIGSPYAQTVPQNDNLDFSPRVGFAYDLTGSGHQVIRGGYGIYYGQIFANIPLFTQQQENSVIYTGVLSLTSSGATDTASSLVPGVGKRLNQYRYGVDPLPSLPTPTAGVLPAGSTGRLLDPDYHNPYNQEFNLGYSLQLSSKDVIEVEGIHSLALRESKRVILNSKDTVTGNRPLTPLLAAVGLPALVQVVKESSIGRSRYDALNISYRHRFANRFSINTNYVRSRALAYGGNAGAFSGAAPDPTNLFGKSELGPTPTDEPHRFVFSGIYKARWGIEVSPIIQWASGRPLNLTEGLDVYGLGSGNGSWRAVVPVASPTAYTTTAASSYTAAAIRTGLANGSLTTLPFDAIRAGRFYQLDLSVSKTFTIKERQNIKLLCQMFDATNHANFGASYGTSIRSTTFLQPTGFVTTSGSVVPHAFTAEFGFRYSF